MSEETASGSSGRSWLMWVGLVIAVFVAFQFLPIKSWLESLDGWIKYLGYWGPLAFVIIYILATVFLLPGAAMTPLSGLLFGLGWGTLWVVVASNIASNISFLTGRYFARDAVAKKIADNPKFAAIDRAVGSEGWKMVALTRISPVFPFVLLNYAYGVTSVKWSHYALASLAGMLPGTVMFVYFGSLGKLAAESEAASTGKIVLMVVGGIATVVVTLWVTRSAKKVLNEKADLEA
ncbi:MAG: TVP38/TMEM64 family protein [Verrucomicrobiales bacterium]|nr:TVP38/TMEM64 family protein [Verrucomicrobiales bacterium]